MVGMEDGCQRNEGLMPLSDECQHLMNAIIRSEQTVGVLGQWESFLKFHKLIHCIRKELYRAFVA